MVTILPAIIPTVEFRLATELCMLLSDRIYSNFVLDAKFYTQKFPGYSQKKKTHTTWLILYLYVNLSATTGRRAVGIFQIYSFEILGTEQIRILWKSKKKKISTSIRRTENQIGNSPEPSEWRKKEGIDLALNYLIKIK